MGLFDNKWVHTIQNRVEKGLRVNWPTFSYSMNPLNVMGYKYSYLCLKIDFE
jgi:hypothetical protein